MPYSKKISKEEEKRIGKAFGAELNISPKASNEICASIRGMMANKALKFLEDIQKGKKYVKYRHYNKKIPHRKGGVQGRYPKKAAKYIANVLKNAIANAEHKGLYADNLKVVHATAYKGLRLERIRPRGRGGHGFYRMGLMHGIDLTNVEIMVKG